MCLEEKDQITVTWEELFGNLGRVVAFIDAAFP
jgi:hypothetical protein